MRFGAAFALTGRDGDRRRVVAIAVAAVLFLTLALIFTNAYGSGRVAANARALHWTNATLGSASIARASNAQGIVFTVDGFETEGRLADPSVGPPHSPRRSDGGIRVGR